MAPSGIFETAGARLVIRIKLSLISPSDLKVKITSTTTPAAGMNNGSRRVRNRRYQHLPGSRLSDHLDQWTSHTCHTQVANSHVHLHVTECDSVSRCPHSFKGGTTPPTMNGSCRSPSAANCAPRSLSMSENDSGSAMKSSSSALRNKKISLGRLRIFFSDTTTQLIHR